MTKQPFEWKRDAGGLILFGAGAFVSVLMVKSLASDQPLEQQTGTAAFAALLAGIFGALPWLVFAAGIGFLGARSFVTASEGRALRHVLGLAGITIGLSILLGAFSDTGGGKFGLWTGGKLGLLTHATLGGLLGLVVALSTAWFAWLREPGAPHAEQIRSSVTDRAQVADPGVTAAEAAGLIPEEPAHVRVLVRNSNYVPLSSHPPSPYPEDVRLKGQVPAGARPIATSNAALEYQPPTRIAPQQHAEPALERAQPFQPGAHLAPAASSAAPLAEPAVRPVRPVPAGAQPLAPTEEELRERSEDFDPAEETRPDSPPARPSWEQTGLGEDDEPVDAYGTPLSLVESLRKAQSEMIAIPESDDEVEDDLDEPEVDDDEGAFEEATPVAAVAPRELDQAAMVETEEFAAEEEGFVEIVQEFVPASELEEPVADVRPLAQTTIFDFTDEAQAGVELFPEGVPDLAGAPAPLEEPFAEVQVELEPEGEIEIEVGDEPEVVLQPQAAPADRAHKPHSVDPQRARLLAEAGCLFVERGRVAVSMLQRQYGMDFDDACKVLDELQDLGLIGPYLGGQSRDILLTRDQWLEKAGAI